MYQGATPTKFGRFQVAEPLRFDLFHQHDGGELKTVDHEPPIPVLDQEDLLAQGIDTSTVILGATKVDALGSCTCNAGTASLAERLLAGGKSLAGTNGVLYPDVEITPDDSRANELFAICLYHVVTAQTGDPGQEWPPTDCGSTGLYVCTELQKLGVISSYRVATNLVNALSLLQVGTVIMGAPWFNSWMQPNADGFIDGDGTLADLQAAVNSGVAGGHETCLSAIEAIEYHGANLNYGATVLRVRNSWSSNWGDRGSYRIHASTLNALGSAVDYKQFVV